MTTTPTASSELLDLDRLEALAHAATPGRWMRLFGERTVYDRMEDGCRGNAIVRADLGYGPQDISNLDFIAGANPAAVLALIALARRAQPEGEAPQAAAHRAVIEEAAQVLESAAAHNRAKGRTVLERTQQDRADRLRAILAQPAATLSPLCGAQHAESDEFPISRSIYGSLEACEAEYQRRADLAAQQAAAPADCSGTPSSCPDNEGYGCHCSAPGTPEAPKPPFPISDDEMAALRRFWECATDGEGYDVEKAMMQRLAEMGLVQRKSGAYYMATDFGLYVLGECTIQRAAQLDGGQEGSESNG